jgi:sugar-specific transcriptional regulator TrmB
LGEDIVRKTLRNFGLTEKETDIYIFLAKHGVLKGGEISKQTKTQKALVYRILKSLQAKSLVESTLEFPARFTPIPFENVIDLNIRVKHEEAAQIASQKKELINYWQKIKKAEPEPQLEKFTAVEGRTLIYSKIQQMIQEAKKQVLAITTVPTLAQADQRGIFDASCTRPFEQNLQFRFLAELSEQNVHAVKALLEETVKGKLNIEVRNPELGLALFPQMLVRDEEEAIFFVKPRMETSIIEQEDVCLWTNCKTLVRAFVSIFEDLWRDSTDGLEKISEIETGRPTPKTFEIEDAETSREKYEKILKSATKEVLVLTTSKGLVEFWQNTPRLKEWTEKGIAVKIMAPIVGENLKDAKQLSKLFSVKHVPPNYVPTTIIDGKHLFQFTASTARKQPFDSQIEFQNTLYTTDPEYVQKTKTMFDEHWKNGRQLLTDNLESLFGTGVRSQCSAYFPGAIRGPGPSGTFYPLSPDPAKKTVYTVSEIVNNDPLGKMTEHDVLNEIINAKEIPPQDHLVRVYSSQATAVIHPPDFLQLPPMLIRAHHIEKHSTYGEQDVIIINLWLETPGGYAYMPVAVLISKSKAQGYWRRHFANSPAGRNVILAKKGELQIRVHGNTLFAGWTVSIPLFPSPYVLPPACILIEGYGDAKTAYYTITGPSGEGLTAKQNGFDAFVTFIHQSSKYSGPGTDGFFVRDFVMDVSPNIFKNNRLTLEHRIIEKRKP